MYGHLISCAWRSAGGQIKYFAISLFVGALAVTSYEIIMLLLNTFLVNQPPSIGLIPVVLESIALIIVPLLLWCVGVVALIQGYFQCKLSNHSVNFSIFIVAFIYTILPIFTDVPTLLFDPFFTSRFFLHRSHHCVLVHPVKVSIPADRLYFRLVYVLRWIIGEVIIVSMEWSKSTFFRFSSNEFSYLLRALILLLVLVLVWSFGHKMVG